MRSKVIFFSVVLLAAHASVVRGAAAQDGASDTAKKASFASKAAPSPKASPSAKTSGKQSSSKKAAGARQTATHQTVAHQAAGSAPKASVAAAGTSPVSKTTGGAFSKVNTASATSTTTSKSGSGAHARASKSTKSRKTVAAAPRRSVQSQPTTERYREIQQSLADRGYFAGSPDGNWGPESVEALKRFQREQNLPEDGKIGSLSLIALGLGPKRASLEQHPGQESAHQEQPGQEQPGQQLPGQQPSGPPAEAPKTEQ